MDQEFATKMATPIPKLDRFNGKKAHNVWFERSSSWHEEQAQSQSVAFPPGTVKQKMIIKNISGDFK